MVDWTSLLAPGSQPGAGGKNDYIAKMLMEQGMDQSPIQSPFQGLARMAQAYVGKKRMDAGADKAAQGNQAMADILAPGTNSVTPGQPQSAPLPGGGSLDYQTPQVSVQEDPKNAQIAALLNGGVGQDQFAKDAIDKLGLGAPKAPIKVGKDDRLYAPDNFNKPLVDVAQAPEDFSKPFDPRTGKPHADVQQFEKDLRAKGRPQMSVNVSADKSFGTQLGENAGKILDASHAAAAGGVQTINTVAQIKNALATGKVTAGPGASAIQFFNQVAGGDQQKVVATRQAIQGLAQLTMAGRGALKGQGQISDYEGKLLAKASSGDIDSMTAKEIETVADVADRNARISIRLNKGNVDKARIAAPKNQDLVDFYNVDEPAPYAPAPKKSGRFTIEQVQ